MIWTPRERDSASIAALLERHGVAVERCHSAHDLAGAITQAGCAIVAQEALAAHDVALLEHALRAQPAWSDFPFILLALKPAPDGPASHAWQALGNVAVLERPARSRSLLAAVAAALRARRRQYEAEQAIVHRDQFLAMLGHELRNPLAAIALATEAERQKNAATTDAALAGRSADVISIISRQARHLTRLVDDLLDVARVMTGKVVLNLAVVDLNDVLERGLQSHALSARERGIELVGVPWPAPVCVRGDVVRLEEVLSNLLANAIEYCPAKARVEAALRPDGERCVLSVRDNGAGISPEMLPRVFDLFAQGEVSLDRSRGGLGIGLTIVKGLIELHGGSVSAHSDGPGTGSTFSVQLPRLDESAEPTAPSSRHVPSAPLAPLPVLVVDDNSDLLEMTREVLEGFGCDVSIARDGPSGLERLREIGPRLAFIDIGLPGLDGYQLAREVRAADVRSRDAQRPWLVAMTGYGQPKDRERALAAGFDRHLTKPVSVAALRQAVEEAARALPARAPAHSVRVARNSTETPGSKLRAH
jgi:signal transduction histidine kinase/DNA-binding NarL/FixJ family response regulator